MPQRLAAVMALIAFAVCLVAGVEADNTFSTTVLRALTAMLVTLVVGLIIGAMAQKMLDENLEPAKKSEIEAKPGKEGR
jgi:NhaP-type Na+/H+ or K+/H+ antiporter